MKIFDLWILMKFIGIKSRKKFGVREKVSIFAVP